MPVMTNTRFRAFRAAFDAFSEIQRQLATLFVGDEAVVETIALLVERTNKAARGALPPFIRRAYTPGFNEPYIKLQGIRAYVGAAVSLLRSAIEGEGPSIGADLLDFTYVHDSRLRLILQRDYREVLRAVDAKCWKAVAILSGGLIEGLLADALSDDVPNATSAAAAPGKNLDILSWRLVDLINVAVELGTVSKGAEKLSHSVRDYRNLIHPHKELKNKLRAEEQEARIALQVLLLIDRDLRP